MDGAAQTMVTSVGQLVGEEFWLLRAVGYEVVELRDELATMNALLRMSSEAEGGAVDHFVQEWMKQLRELAYDAEDCVDLYIFRIRCRKGDGFLAWSKRMVATIFPRRLLAGKIKDLRLRAIAISERHARYGAVNREKLCPSPCLAPVAAVSGQALRPATGAYKLVGIGAQANSLAKKVEAMKNDQDEKLKVFSIVGFGGLGKTTLAMEVCRQLEPDFDRQALVSVSQAFDTGKDLGALLKRVLQQIVKPKADDEKVINEEDSLGSGIDRLSVDDLASKLREVLMDKRYLVLIDDVWSASLLNNIINALPENENSIVIVTTRFHDVATLQMEADTRSVDGLVQEKAKELFKQAYEESKGSKVVSRRPQAPTQISKREEEWSKHTASKPEDRKHGHSSAQSSIQAASEAEGSQDGHSPAESSKEATFETEESKDGPYPDEVWKICGGLPLAIITMAGRVACNPGKHHQYWQKICRDIFPETEKVAVEKLTQEQMGRIVSHCYNDMPAEIQTCSLYLSIIPKGYRISRKRLTRRWIAEGIVCEKDGLGVDVIAETYFNHLIRRKIIQPVEHNGNGKVKKCVVHDMVLELIVRKASEENFITVVGGNWFVQPPSSKVRRLSIQDSDTKHAKDIEKMNLSHVRSLTIFGSLKKQLSSHSFKFRIVQVLDLESCKDLKNHHITEICEMVLLKYLSLRKTETKQIPDDIRKLKNLETLDIRETEVVELPKAVCQLESLVNILGGNKTTRKALRLPADLKKKMKAVQILSGIEIVEKSSELRHLTKLRKLAIYKLKSMLSDASLEALRSSIEYLGGCSLQTLIIDDESSDFVKSLDGLSSPPRFLVALELSGKMIKLPMWIKQLSVLNKLTLSLTALRTDNMRHLSELGALFSLTFCFRAKEQDRQTLAILAENKMCFDGQNTVPDGGFKSLKLLCLSGHLLPLLSFSSKAMPELERLEIRYNILEGILGAEYLVKLEELHLTSSNKEKEDMMTQKISSELGNLRRIDGKRPRVILHQDPLG